MASAAMVFKKIMLIQIVKSTSQGLVRLDIRNKTRQQPILENRVKCYFECRQDEFCMTWVAEPERERERDKERPLKCCVVGINSKTTALMNIMFRILYETFRLSFECVVYFSSILINTSVQKSFYYFISSINENLIF